MTLPHGTAPTTPVNGALWTTTAGLYAQINGATVGPFTSGGVGTTGSPVSGDASFFSGASTVTNAAGILAGATFTATATASGLSYLSNSGTFTTDVFAVGFSIVATSSAALTSSNSHTALQGAGTFNGSAAVASTRFSAFRSYLSGTPTGGSGVLASTHAYAVVTATNNSASLTVVSVDANPLISVGVAGSVLYSCAGVRSAPSVAAAATAGSTTTVTNCFDFLSTPAHSSAVATATLVITNAYGLYLTTPATSGSGTVTITNRYGIYQEDTLAQNFFAGYSGLGIAATTGTALNLPASVAARSSLRIPHGTAPTTNLANGDIWTTTAGMFARINGATVGPFTAGGLTTTGSPASGQSSFFSAATTVTNADGVVAGATSTVSALAGAAQFAMGSGTFTTSVSASALSVTAATTATLTAVVRQQAFTGWITTSSSTTASGNVIAGVTGLVSGTPTAGFAGEYIGVFAYSSRLTDGAAASSTGTFTGVKAITAFDTLLSSGTAATSLYGVRASVQVAHTAASGTSLVTNLFGFASEPTITVTNASATFTITNYYGLYLATHTAAGAGTLVLTNRYGVYQADAAATNLFSGLVSTSASTTTRSGLRIAHGTAPTSPVNGDMWTTTVAPWVRVNGATVVYATAATPFGTLNKFPVWTTTGTGRLVDSALTYSASGGSLTTVSLDCTYTSTGSGIKLFQANMTSTEGTQNATGAAVYGSWSASFVNGTAGTFIAGVHGYGTSSLGVATSGTPEIIGVYGNGHVSGGTLFSGSLYTVVGVRGDATVVNTATQTGTVLNSICGMSAKATLSFTGTLNSATVTEACGLKILAGSLTVATGRTITLTNYYGIYIAGPTTGGGGTASIGNKYGIYQADATSSNFFAGTISASNLSGTNTGDQTITLTSDVTGSGTGSFATTIAAGAVSLGKMANLAANSIIGNNTGSPATPIALTVAQTTAMLDVFTTSLKGLAPASGGGTTNFLRADGTWAAPTAAPGGSTTQLQYNNAGAFGGVGISAYDATNGTLTFTSTTSASGSNLRMLATYLTTTGTMSSGEAVEAVKAYVYVQAGGASNAEYTGVYGSVFPIAVSALRYTDSYFTGGRFQANFTGSATSGTSLGTLVALKAVTSVVMGQTSGSTTISNVYGLQVAPDSFSTASGGTTVITNYYGAYLGTVTFSDAGTTTITNRYGIYQADTSASNYFAGHVKTVESVEVGSAKWFYMGDPTTDGTWRMGRSGNDLLMERRESGSYVTKQTILA